MDRQTREIIGVFIGDRSKESARQLWTALPATYRQCAIIYTSGVLPSKRYRTTEKGSGETNHLERFNNTLR